LQSDVHGRTGKFPLLISSASSNGRCNTIWYIAALKGGVHETRNTVWARSVLIFKMPLQNSLLTLERDPG
jgi:hypothetical protein